MIRNPHAGVARAWGPVVVSALVVVLIAAAAEPDRNRARIRAMPREQREKLLQNLRRFDLELTAEDQRAILELDRRLAELDEARRSEYLAVLHRYHNWLNHLPENRKEEVLAKPPSERMVLIRKLVAEYPVPKADTPQPLRIAELGEYSPFELASIFQIWQAAAPAQRERVQRSPAPVRREALFRLGDTLKIPRETRPASFDEEKWVTRSEGFGRKARSWFPVEELVKKKWEAARD